MIPGDEEDLQPGGELACALPEDWRLVLDPSVSFVRDGSALLGGHPPRMMTLTPAGVAALESLRKGSPLPPSPAARRLGRRLVDAGMAHPRPPADAIVSTAAPASLAASAPPARPIDVTVVVPVRDRATDLDRCLASLGSEHPVLVVDDGSRDPNAIASICRRHGVQLLMRPTSGGPAAARNNALAVVDSELVAFVDSDCLIRPSAIRALARYFIDPTVGAVAPRIRPSPVNGDGGGTGLAPTADGPLPPLIERYAIARSALDMGPDEGPVGPGRQVRYVPAAALLVRRHACGRGFDPELRVGEDVDFVWRLADSGWQVRYDPAVVAVHREPEHWFEHLARRFRYGTSAGPLARRHPDRMAPVELHAGAAVVVAALAAGRVRLAAVLWSTGTGLALRRLANSGIPSTQVVGWQLAAPWWTLLGVARAATTLAAPVVLVDITRRRGRRRRVIAVAVLVLPGLVEWWQRRPDIAPVPWVTACLADDLAYGAGVWVGSARSWTAAPLLPTVRLPALRRSEPRRSQSGRL